MVNALSLFLFYSQVPKSSKSQGGQKPADDSARTPQRRYSRAANTNNNDSRSNLFGVSSTYNPLFSNLTLPNITDLDVEDEEPLPYEVAIVHAKNEVILPNLKHFQEYSIEVS